MHESTQHVGRFHQPKLDLLDNSVTLDSSRLSSLASRYLKAIELGTKCHGGFQDGTIVDLKGFDGDTIVVGDLHARDDSLADILFHDDTLIKILDGKAVLVQIGDLIHNDVEGMEAEMDSSLNTLCTWMRLKCLMPTGFYGLRGNHDGLNTGVSKGNVSQGDLFAKHLIAKTPVDFYVGYQESLEKGAMLAIGQHFAAIHAGPIRSATSLEQIRTCCMRDDYYLNMDPILVDAIMSRMNHKTKEHRRYNQEHIRAFLELCNVPADGHLIVGHSAPPPGTWQYQPFPNHWIITATGERAGYMRIRGDEITPVDVRVIAA